VILERDADNDGDGLTNEQEVLGLTGYFTDPLDKDSDNDGFNDGDEINKGFDPTDRDNHPAGSSAIKFGDPFLILIFSVFGVLVIISRKKILSSR
jgi:hypothetical protein